MVDQSSFEIISKTIDVDFMRKVDYIQIELVATDTGKTAGSDESITPTVYFTDVMFQGGSVATSWVGHVSEIRWSFDVT